MPSLSRLTVADLRRELERRERGSKRLLSRHAALSSRLSRLESELADLGIEVGANGRGGRRAMRRGPGRPRTRVDGRSKRAKNSMTLLESILKGVPTGKTVSPAEAGAAAKKAGYKSSSKTFGVMVATCLAKAKEFKRTGRGAYLRLGARSAKAPRGRKARKASSKPAVAAPAAAS
jgi:hypothetical protein